MSKDSHKPIIPRIGHGFDVHRLSEGRRLILGGVEIDYPLGLLGHSDADVLTHAVMDALLGAAALGDIGSHFPDTDDRYSGADSITLAAEVGELIRDSGYSIGNIDVTLLAQKPKIAPYIPIMRERLSEALAVPRECISIKATTEEGLGYTGSGDGMACHAVALILPLC